jgi:hypothetical protein
MSLLPNPTLSMTLLRLGDVWHIVYIKVPRKVKKKGHIACNILVIHEKVPFLSQVQACHWVAIMFSDALTLVV